MQLLEQTNDDEVCIPMVITEDEDWVYGYDIQTNVQSSQWVKDPYVQKEFRYHDNAPASLTISIHQFSVKKQMPFLIAVEMCTLNFCPKVKQPAVIL